MPESTVVGPAPVLALGLVGILIRLRSYICGIDIKGYSHFGANSCPLHDFHVPLNVRHEQETKAAEDRTVALLVAKHPEISPSEFRDMVAKQMEISRNRR
jgi:hypothetical protein